MILFCIFIFKFVGARYPKGTSSLRSGRSSLNSSSSRLHISKYKKRAIFDDSIIWLRGQDSNLRPLGYEPNELPTAPPRDVFNSKFLCIIYLYNTFVKIFFHKYYYIFSQYLFTKQNIYAIIKMYRYYIFVKEDY